MDTVAVKLGKGRGEFVGAAVSTTRLASVGVGKILAVNIFRPKTITITTTAIAPNPANAQVGKRFKVMSLDVPAFDSTFVAVFEN